MKINQRKQFQTTFSSFFFFFWNPVPEKSSLSEWTLLSSPLSLGGNILKFFWPISGRTACMARTVAGPLWYSSGELKHFRSVRAELKKVFQIASFKCVIADPEKFKIQISDSQASSSSTSVCSKAKCFIQKNSGRLIFFNRPNKPANPTRWTSGRYWLPIARQAGA